VVQRWLRPAIPSILTSDQYAFKPTGSTTAALVNFTHHASNNNNNNNLTCKAPVCAKKTSVALEDFSGA